MRNYPEWCISFLAITSIGAIIVPLNSLWKGAEMTYGLQDSGTKLLFCDGERLGYAADALKQLQIPAIVCHNDKGVASPTAKVHQYNAVVGERRGQPAPPFPAHLGRDDIAAIFYTSGSTGNPKGVCQTHRGITDQIWGGVEIYSAFAKQLGMPETEAKQSALVCAVPLFHVTGSHHIFLSAMMSQSKLVLMYKWDPLEALKMIDEHKPQKWNGVPTMVQDLMEHPDFDKYDTSSMKNLGGGGAPTPQSQVEKVSKKFTGGAKASNGYGLTETNGGICGISGAEYSKRPTSCGQPQPLMEVCIANEVTEDGEMELVPAANTRGELCIRGSLVMQEYWGLPKKTASSLVQVPSKGGGWFRTGDIAMLDEEGYIFIVDRIKDLIIRGGENIGCAEVESVFFTHPAVLEVSCFGLKDTRLGERVGVCVVIKDSATFADATPAALLAHVLDSNLLAKFKIPQAADIFVQREKLDRGETGKILKRQIRLRFNEMVSKAAGTSSKM